MQFTAATIALFAGLAAAWSNEAETTVYSTDMVTITSCAPTVTNCPASSMQSTSTPAAVAPVSSSTAPAPVVSSAPAPVMSSAPAPAPPASTPSVTVVTHTSCVPTTWVQTVTAAPSPVSPVGSSQPKAPSSSVPYPAGSASPSASPVYTGAGAVTGSSMTFAGIAAAAAFFLA